MNTSRHVKFVENSFPYASLIKPSPDKYMIPLVDHTKHTVLPTQIFTNTSPKTPVATDEPQTCAPKLILVLIGESHQQSHIYSKIQSGNNFSPPYSNIPPNPTRPVTWSQNKIFKPQQVFLASKHELPKNIESSTIMQALKIPH